MYPIKMMTPMDANSYSAFQSASWPACHGNGSHGLRDFLHIPPSYGHTNMNHNFPLHLMNHRQSTGTSELHYTKDKFSNMSIPLQTLVPFASYSPYRVFNQHCAPHACHGECHGIRDSDLHVPPSFGHMHHHFPLHLLQHKSGSEVHCSKDRVTIKLDVHQFSPDELMIKAADNDIVVVGMHDEKEDEHGYITRSFCRRYPLPQDINPDDFDDRVTCELSSDGVLMITIPRRTPLELGAGREAKLLQIKQTGQPAMPVK